MKKIRKAIVSLSLLTPVMVVVSCGGKQGPSKEELANIKDIKEINENANATTSSDFMDDIINSKTEEKWMFDSEEPDTKGEFLNWNSAQHYNDIWNTSNDETVQYPGNKWGSISTNTFQSTLRNQTNFMEKDLSHEISTFVRNYMSFMPHNNLLSSSAHLSTQNSKHVFTYEKNNSYNGSDKEIMPVFSWGGPLPSMNRLLYSFESMRWWRSLAYDVDVEGKIETFYDKKINQIPKIFEQPQYNFDPRELFFKKLGWDEAFRYLHNYWDYKTFYRKLIDHIETFKNYKNYPLYERAVKNHEISGYTALKILTGNLDLKPSELFEVTSAGLALISAQKKKMLEDMHPNKDIVWVGGSYGNDDMMQSILLDNDILYKSKAVILWGNYLRSAIKNSYSYSGGIVTRQAFERQRQDADLGSEADSIFDCIEYTKMKYGFINRLKEKLENDQKFKEEFIKKVHIYIGNNDRVVGKLSDYEKNFYEKYHIDYHMKNGGHTFGIIDKGDAFWKNIMYTERPDYTRANYTGDYRYTIREVTDPRLS